jgi:hypothetical protein
MIGQEERTSRAVERLQIAALCAVIALMVGLPHATASAARGDRMTLLAAELGVALLALAAAPRLRIWIRGMLAAAIVISIYESIGMLIAGTGAPARAAWIIHAERLITGGWLPPLAPWRLPSPVVDALSVAYVLYFFLPGWLLWSLSRHTGREAAERAMFVLAAAFYLHYAIYVAIPVIGPLRAVELPDASRVALLEAGGRITRGVRAAVGALEGTREDAFPSAHTSISVLVATLAWRHRLRGRRVCSLIAGAIVVSTVALGYHYVVDVLAAAPIVILLGVHPCVRTRAATRRGDMMASVVCADEAGARAADGGVVAAAACGDEQPGRDARRPIVA